MALDVHQRKCPSCNDYIPFTRKFLVFRPLPKMLVCPTCGHRSSTTFFQRAMAFFFWTMRTYMLLAIVFMILVGYTNMGLWDEYGPSKLPWYIISYGVPTFFMCAGVCLVSTFTLQALVDYVFKVGDRNETD